MTVYLTVIALEFIAYVISLNFKQEQQNKVFLTIGSIPVILVSALRYRSVGGNDPINYYNNFVLSQKFDLPTFLETAPMEDGYLIFVKTLSSIFKDPQWLFFWVALVCTVCVSYFIYKNSKDPFLSMMLYLTLELFTFTLCGVRQSLAMSIILISTEFIKKRKFVWFALLVILAAQFHITAFVFLPFYFIGHIKINTLNMMVCTAAGAVVAYFMNNIVAWANETMGKSYETVALTGGYINIVIYILLFAVSFMYKDKLFKEKTNTIMLMMSLVGFLMYIMRYFSTRVTERISFFFFYAILILLPNAIQQIKDKKERQSIYMIALVLTIALFVYRTKGSTLVPYKFFWEMT